jgi:hypothetical protein
MATKFTVQNVEELNKMVSEKDFRIAEAIVNGIISNLNGKKKNIHLLSITCLDENSICDVSVERKYFAQTLEENLSHYIKEEKYEECQKIVNIINELKNK